MAAVRAILWDNDGVLVDTERLFYEANRHMLAGQGITLSERDFFNWYLLHNCGAWHVLRGRGADRDRIDALRTERDQLYTDLLAAAGDTAIPGMPALLADLAPRVPMGIVTSARRVHFDAIHAGLGLLPHFRFVLTSDMYGRSKPSPEPYLLGLDTLGVPAEQCLVVEDSPRGLQAARAAGIRCIVLRNSMSMDFPFEGAHCVVDTVQSLREAIDGLL